MKRNNQKYNNITTIAKSQCFEHGKKVTIIKRNWKSLLKKENQKSSRK